MSGTGTDTPADRPDQWPGWRRGSNSPAPSMVHTSRSPDLSMSEETRSALLSPWASEIKCTTACRRSAARASSAAACFSARCLLPNIPPPVERSPSAHGRNNNPAHSGPLCRGPRQGFTCARAGTAAGSGSILQVGE